MKVTARTPIRHGDKSGATDYAEGDTFDVSKADAEALIASGAVEAAAAGAKVKSDQAAGEGEGDKQA